MTNGATSYNLRTPRVAGGRLGRSMSCGCIKAPGHPPVRLCSRLWSVPIQAGEPGWRPERVSWFNGQSLEGSTSLLGFPPPRGTTFANYFPTTRQLVPRDSPTCSSERPLLDPPSQVQGLAGGGTGYQHVNSSWTNRFYLELMTWRVLRSAQRI